MLLTNKLDLTRLYVSHIRHQSRENWYRQTYRSGQLKTFVAVVISVINLVVPLSQDHPPHHHSQVNTLGPEIKLLHLQTKKKKRLHLVDCTSNIHTSQLTVNIQEHV